MSTREITDIGIELRCGECDNALTFTAEIYHYGKMTLEVQSCVTCDDKHGEQREVLEDQVRELKEKIDVLQREVDDYEAENR